MALGLFAQGKKENDTQGITTITWWHSNSGLLQEATDAMVGRFNETIGKEQGIKVQAVYQGKASDVLTKIKAIDQGGNNSSLPDLVQLDAQAILDIRDNPVLIDAETLAKENNYDLSQIVESARLSQTYKGKMIGMPFNSSTILLYYNKTAFDQAGIKEAPKTLDELATDSQRLLLKDDKGTILRYGFSGVPTTYELCAWLGQQNGLSLICDMNNGHDGIPQKMLFDSNGTMDNFLTKWKQLYATGALDTATSGISASFASGKTVMMVASTSQLTTTLEMIGDRFELGVANLPAVDDKATGGVNIGGGALYTLDNASNHSKETWQFVQFAVSAEEQLAWHIATGYFPVNSGTYELDAFKQHVQDNPLFGIAIKQMRESNPQLQGIWVPSSYQIYYAFQSGILKMLTENKDVHETTLSLAKEIDGYLTDYLNMQATK